MAERNIESEVLQGLREIHEHRTGHRLGGQQLLPRLDKSRHVWIVFADGCNKDQFQS